MYYIHHCDASPIFRSYTCHDCEGQCSYKITIGRHFLLTQYFSNVDSLYVRYPFLLSPALMKHSHKVSILYCAKQLIHFFYCPYNMAFGVCRVFFCCLSWLPPAVSLSVNATVFLRPPTHRGVPCYFLAHCHTSGSACSFCFSFRIA